jgi:hypothetical protein
MLGRTARDVAANVGEFRNDPPVCGLSPFRSLERQLAERRVAVPGTDGAGPAVPPRDSKEAAADSLQPPATRGRPARATRRKASRSASPKSRGGSKKNTLEPSPNPGLRAASAGAHASGASGVEHLAARLETLGIKAKSILADNARNAPRNREPAAGHGADMPPRRAEAWRTLGRRRGGGRGQVLPRGVQDGRQWRRDLSARRSGRPYRRPWARAGTP